CFPSDPELLAVLERAVELFSHAASVPCCMDTRTRNDYASIDVYLMRDSLEKYGLWKAVYQ
ncbi:MAG: hypothetical protein RQ767_07710, partial [Thermovirgaceae bacterium]|nr:hypothetical protein [Thermovirgaceae bacterium]